MFAIQSLNLLPEDLMFTANCTGCLFPDLPVDVKDLSWSILQVRKSICVIANFILVKGACSWFIFSMYLEPQDRQTDGKFRLSSFVNIQKQVYLHQNSWFLLTYSSCRNGAKKMDFSLILLAGQSRVCNATTFESFLSCKISLNQARFTSHGINWMFTWTL